MIRATLVLLASVAPVAAEVPFLALPIDCTLGRTCFIEDYVDADPGPRQTDYTCGIKSRDGHRGTDIVLDSFAAMDRGVAVLAAADGVVQAIRDGVEDVAYTPETGAAVKGRECGNAVRILHGNGYQTLYCHMKKGSVSVRSGDAVTAGTPLGLVGMSGQSNIPHIHLSVLKDGAVIDPFAPETQSCGEETGSLWLDDIPYETTGFITAGMTDSVPDFDAVKSGAARKTRISSDAPLVLYGYFHDAQNGDVLSFEASGPEGRILSHSAVLTDVQRGMYRAFGRRAPDGGWPEGAYRGVMRLMRGDRLLAWRHADTVVE